MIVPAHLKSEPYLVLQYGYDLPIPISDLEVDEHGVRATLSFSKHPQRTVVPWSAVYVVTCDDGRCVLYQEDVPEDVSIIATHPRPDHVSEEADVEALADVDAQAEEAADDVPAAAEAESAAEGTTQRTAVGSSRRASVPGTTGPSGRISERLLRSVPHDEAVPEAEDPPSSRRRRKPQLRLVK